MVVLGGGTAHIRCVGKDSIRTDMLERKEL